MYRIRSFQFLHIPEHALDFINNIAVFLPDNSVSPAFEYNGEAFPGSLLLRNMIRLPVSRLFPEFFSQNVFQLRSRHFQIFSVKDPARKKKASFQGNLRAVIRSALSLYFPVQPASHLHGIAVRTSGSAVYIAFPQYKFHKTANGNSDFIHTLFTRSNCRSPAPRSGAPALFLINYSQLCRHSQPVPESETASYLQAR